MRYLDCFKLLAAKRTDQFVVTSAGNSGQAWWAATRDTERAFYLDASMSLSTMFTSGLAAALPQARFWAFMGDGAFCMNPGMLMVEKQMNLPNLTHLLVSNGAYGATSNAALPNAPGTGYAAIARAMGLEQVFEFSSLEELENGFDAAIGAPAQGHRFVVLNVEPFNAAEQKLEQPPFDAPELKYLFGRSVEKLTGANVFGYRI
jgi:thiamine pyrophosphate-dependent acetolactate synthase large subunit-like protein